MRKIRILLIALMVIALIVIIVGLLSWYTFVSENIYRFYLGIIIIISETVLGIKYITIQEEQKDNERKKKDNEKSIFYITKKKLELSEKIDCLKHLSKIHRSQFDERRKIEWKLIFAILVFYFGIITAKIASTNTNSIDPNSIDPILKLMVSLAFFSIAALAICYLTYFHLANHKNKSFAENSSKAIQDLLKGIEPNFEIFEFEKKNIWSNWSFKMQFLLLFSMAFCSSGVIWI